MQKTPYISVSVKLLTGVLLISSVLTIFTIGFQIFLDYRSELNDLDKRMVLIEKTYLNSIINLVWSYNEEQIDLALEGLLNIPDVDLVQIREAGNVLYKRGTMPGEATIRIFPLHVTTPMPKELGTLEVYVANAHIKERMLEKIILIVLSQSLKTFVASFLILLLVNHLINRHLKTMRVFFADLKPDSGRYGKLELDRKISQSTDEFDFLRDSVNHLVGLVKDLVENLEARIRERTEELWRESRDVESLLENMRQGVFTIGGNLQIGRKYSKHLETIVGTTNIAGVDVDTLLFQDSDLSVSARSQVRSVIEVTIGYSAVQFHANRHLLPTHIIRNEQKLEMEWSTIQDRNREVEKVLVMVRDVTEIDQLRSVAERRRLELEIIDRIIEMRVKTFITFYNEAVAALNDFLTRLSQGKLSRKDINEIFLVLHTLKGNAAMYRLEMIVDATHSAEHYCIQVRDDPEAEIVPEQLQAALEHTYESLHFIYQVVETKLRDVMRSEMANINILNVVDSVIRNEQGFTDQQNLMLLRKIVSLRKAFLWEAITQILDDPIRSLPGLAGQLGKEPPLVEIFENGILLDAEIAPFLRKALLHCFRNAIDHGLESPTERRACGKPARGKITLRLVSDSPKEIKIYFNDDGRGLNLGALREKAARRGNATLNDAEVAEMIFEPGVSTAATTTVVSGRGVGMDAVRKLLKKIRGDVRIDLGPETADTSFRSFILVISLPGRYALSKTGLGGDTPG